uniref:MAPK regulated corepressor interacting protein 1 n=1 Tax=Catagonus wagneri TaxID=51154 RepID=A0A8C3WBS1_9CETA
MTSSPVSRVVYNGKRNSSPRSPPNSSEIFTPAHEENVRFIYEAWQGVERDLRSQLAGSERGLVEEYVEKVPNPSLKSEWGRPGGRGWAAGGKAPRHPPLTALPRRSLQAHRPERPEAPEHAGRQEVLRRRSPRPGLRGSARQLSPLAPGRGGALLPAGGEARLDWTGTGVRRQGRPPPWAPPSSGGSRAAPRALTLTPLPSCHLLPPLPPPPATSRIRRETQGLCCPLCWWDRPALSLRWPGGRQGWSHLCPAWAPH